MADSAVKEQMWKLKKKEYFSIEFLLWTVFDSHITNPAFATIICPTTQLPLSYSLLLNNGNCSAYLCYYLLHFLISLHPTSWHPVLYPLLITFSLLFLLLLSLLCHSVPAVSRWIRPASGQ